MSAGLYVHIPFCHRKCPYCDFYSVAPDSETADIYTKVLCNVISSGRFEPGEIDTVYFGGGTPPAIGVKNLARILDTAVRIFDIASGAEMTIEINPAANTGSLFRELRRAGFNRISIGTQSASDGELAALARPHSASDAKNAILSAHQAGFSAISCDLMLGIPRQTHESLRGSIDFFTKTPVSHISAYLLKIEEGTAFAQKNATADCPGEDEAAELYLECVAALEAAGFQQYEISNFARPGAQSLHNLKYWRCEPYLGIGPSAHSYLGGERFYFERDLHAFLREPFAVLTGDGRGGGFEEYAMLRLRLTEGLDLSSAEKLYGADANVLCARAKPYVENGLAVYSGNRVKLTPKGFLLSNAVTAGLLYG